MYITGVLITKVFLINLLCILQVEASEKKDHHRVIPAKFGILCLSEDKGGYNVKSL
jgi:hypothetical protein